MANRRKPLKLKRTAVPNSGAHKASDADTPRPIQKVKQFKPAKSKAKETKDKKPSTESEEIPTKKASTKTKPEIKKPKTTTVKPKKTVKLTSMKDTEPKTVRYTIEVNQVKYGHEGQEIDTHQVPLVISGETGSVVTLTPRYLTAPKGYEIKNPHQTWKIKMNASGYKVQSKTQQISFDYISKRAGTLTILYTDQNGTQVDTQHVSGYVDDSVGLSDLKEPSGYDLSTHIFQPITLTPQAMKVDLSVRGKMRNVVATVKQELYSADPKETSTKIEITGRVGDLKQIEPDQIDVPNGYRIRPGSKQMQLRITADKYQVPANYPLVIHYVTTQPLYSVINFMDQNQRLVKDQVIRGQWGHYIDESALTLPHGYEFDRNNPARLRMTKMIQVWRLQVRGAERSENATINLRYMSGHRVVQQDQRTVTVSARVGSIYRIPSVRFYRSGFKPNNQELDGIMTDSGLNHPAIVFTYQRDPNYGVQHVSADEAKTNNTVQPNSDVDKEAEAHRRAHDQKTRVARQRAAMKKAPEQQTDNTKTAAQSIPSKPKQSKNPQNRVMHRILDTNWKYIRRSNVVVPRGAKF